MRATRNGSILRWGVLWRSRDREEIQWDCDAQGRPNVFRTRERAREYISSRYGYISTRPDLKRAPHWWRLPRAVRVRVTLAVL